MAHASYLEMRSLLAEVVGLDPTQPPIPAGPLNLPSGEPATLSVLVQGALEHRDDLAALQQARRATEARKAAAVAARVPDLSLSAYFEEEASTDRIVGAGLRISLPFFQRNQGAIAEAHAAIDRASAELESREKAIRREVFSTLSRYRAARSSAQTLAHHVVGTLTESLDLLGRSFAAGKIGLPDLLLSRRELIEGQREFIEAVAAAWVARVTLDLAVGRVPGVSDQSATRLEVFPSQVTPESES